jgi:Fe-S cluster assembly protein SufD
MKPVRSMQQRGIPQKEAFKALLMSRMPCYRKHQIPELNKKRITKIIANKLGVKIGFDL